ncbi:diguanylate cyclase (GGDEF) domain-containing protein [Acidiphilium rubrum]|uniref:Diguanylate cyclase (GGDEF) domain-containing protein n=2 Tax=Acidiphilium TaxID=522 RepID=A0A8G2FL51_ACIRU|nr:diguanylate cyclase (GGDEF) domain-containing protein [Acidiphilium rubrum]
MQLLNFITNLGYSSKNSDRASSDIRRQIELSQLGVRATLAPRMGLTGFIVAAALSWSFWDHHDAFALRSGLIGVFASYIGLFAISASWWRDHRRNDRLKRYQFLFCLVASLIGVFWSAVIMFGLRDANLIQTSTLYALAVGLMSAPAFSGPALYAFALWIPITIGSFLAIMIDAATPPIPSLIGLLSYAFLTFTSILSVNASTIDRELKRIEAERQNALIGLLLRDFQEGTSDFLWEADADLDLVRPSARFAEAAFTTEAALDGTSIIRFLTDHRARCVNQTNDGVIATLIDHVGRRQPFHEQRVELSFGTEIRCWSMTGKPILGADGQFIGYRGVGSDVTAIRQAERQIDHIARHDNLTGLANRMSFDAALASLCATPGDGAALLCIDLDHFKSVNDRFGHQTGDALLVAAVQRILGCVREHDRPFRLGGDEFGIILPTTDQATAELIAARIVHHLAQPFRIDQVNLTIGACVGIAMVTANDQNPADVHHAADLALYRAKAEGRGTHRAFAAQAETEARQTRDIKFALNNDLDLGAFYLEYQPIVALATGHATSVEALVRWDHPQYGVLRPDLFIPEAEHSGAIIPIGRHVLAIACDFAATLPDEVSVAINLSAVQVHDAGLIETIANNLARNALAPGRIVFELTETAILNITPETVATLDGIKALGCRLSLDDFGSGFSSIATLYYVQFDRLKIDRTLIHDAMGDCRRRAILRNITHLAREIGMRVTGEGVESEQMKTALTDLGFDHGQGSLFSPALRDAALHDWLNYRTQALPDDTAA